MKKIFLSLLALLAVGMAADAQTWGFGPKAGVAFSSANNVNGSKVHVGAVVGAFANRWINDWFSIQGELLFSQQGYNTRIEGVSNKYRLNYIAMPVLTKFYLLDGLNFELGGQLAYRVTAQQKIGDNSFVNMKNVTNRFNVNFIAGLSYDFDFGLILEGRYLLSLNDVTTTGKARTGALQVLVGWQF